MELNLKHVLFVFLGVVFISAISDAAPVITKASLGCKDKSCLTVTGDGFSGECRILIYNSERKRIRIVKDDVRCRRRNVSFRIPGPIIMNHDQIFVSVINSNGGEKSSLVKVKLRKPIIKKAKMGCKNKDCVELKAVQVSKYCTATLIDTSGKLIAHIENDISCREGAIIIRPSDRILANYSGAHVFFRNTDAKTKSNSRYVDFGKQDSGSQEIWRLVDKVNPGAPEEDKASFVRSAVKFKKKAKPIVRQVFNAAEKKITSKRWYQRRFYGLHVNKKFSFKKYKRGKAQRLLAYDIKSYDFGDLIPWGVKANVHGRPKAWLDVRQNEPGSFLRDIPYNFERINPNELNVDSVSRACLFLSGTHVTADANDLTVDLSKKIKLFTIPIINKTIYIKAKIRARAGFSLGGFRNSQFDLCAGLVKTVVGTESNFLVYADYPQVKGLHLIPPRVHSLKLQGRNLISKIGLNLANFTSYFLKGRYLEGFVKTFLNQKIIPEGMAMAETEVAHHLKAGTLWSYSHQIGLMREDQNVLNALIKGNARDFVRLSNSVTPGSGKFTGNIPVEGL